MKFSELKRLREESRVILQATGLHSTAVTGTTMNSQGPLEYMPETLQ